MDHAVNRFRPGGGFAATSLTFPFAMMPSFLHCNVRMIALGKRWLTLLLLCILIIVVSAAAFASDDWQVIKVGGHDYLSVDNIAKFYSFPAGVPLSGRKIGLEDVNRSLEFTLDSREIMINGARNWLCFPVIEHEGKFLVSRMDLAKTLEPQLRPQRIPNLDRVQTVVLDPGHGGYHK